MDFKNKLKREVDDCLTKNVLSAIRHAAMGAARQVADQMATRNIGSRIRTAEYYYLKGGKSIQILEQTFGTGDWDFQLKPTQGVYGRNSKFRKNHHQRFQQFHRGIFKMLWEAAHDHLNRTQVGAAGTNEYPDLLALIDNSVADDDHYAGVNLHAELIKAYEKVLPGAKVRQIEFVEVEPDCFSVGQDYLHYDESQILRHSKFNKNGEGRLHIDEEQRRTALTGRALHFHPARDGHLMDAANYESFLRPKVYVNGSIPGFILYRLAVGF